MTEQYPKTFRGVRVWSMSFGMKKNKQQNMKWKELNGKNDPPFDQFLIIWINDIWISAMLHQIVITEKGKQYEFMLTHEKTLSLNATHFLIPTPPTT